MGKKRGEIESEGYEVRLNLLSKGAHSPQLDNGHEGKAQTDEFDATRQEDRTGDTRHRTCVRRSALCQGAIRPAQTHFEALTLVSLQTLCAIFY